MLPAAATVTFMIIVVIMIVAAILIMHMPATAATIAKIQQDHPRKHHDKNRNQYLHNSKMFHSVPRHQETHQRKSQCG